MTTQPVPRRFLVCKVVLVGSLITLGCTDDAVPPTGPDDEGSLARLVVLGGDDQARFPGSDLVEPLVVGVADDAGNPVARGGIRVNWTVLSGGGSVKPEIVMTAVDGTAAAVWTLGPGTGTQTLEASVGESSAVRFSAVASLAGPIVFRSTRGAAASKLFVMETDGSNVIQLTTGSEADMDPRWSPDGERVAFARELDGATRLHVVAADGSGLTQLTLEEGRKPSWSPDATRIAFVRSEAIWLLDLADGSERRLTNHSLGDDDPEWLVDGSRIAFSRRTIDSPLRHCEVWAVSTDGSTLSQLTSVPSVNSECHFSPRSSPDGSGLMYGRVVTTARVRDPVIEFVGPFRSLLVDGEPGAWSPDGSRILVVFGEDGAAPNIALVDLDAVFRTRTELTDGGINTWPDWRR